MQHLICTCRGMYLHDPLIHTWKKMAVTIIGNCFEEPPPYSQKHPTDPSMLAWTDKMRITGIIRVLTVLLASWSVAKIIHPLLGFETCQPDRLCHWSVVCTIKLVSMSVGMTPVEQVAGLTNSWNKSYASLVNSCFFNGARLVSIFKQYL